MSKPKGQRIVYRSAITGKIVKASTARRWPQRTFQQRFPMKPRRKK